MADIRNRTMNPTNKTVAGVIKHLQDNYGQLMPHKLLEWEDISKKKIYNPRKPIVTLVSVIKELL